jgi:hypothetical protein
MTATANRTVPAPRPADVRRLDRRVAAILMPIGPAAVAILRVRLPADPSAHPGAQRIVVWLGLVAVLTLLPGALAAIRLLRRYTPRLATGIAALLVPGYLGMTALIAADAGALAAIDLGMPAGGVTALSEAVVAVPTMAILVLVFVVGHILGTLLLGIAALRAGVIPRPVAVALAASQFAHLAAVIGGWPLVDLLAWTTTAVGMAFLARVVLRTPDDEWDLPPLVRC